MGIKDCPYVILAKVEIFSDCLTAIAALRKGEGSKRIMKWFVEMSQYSYTLTYKPGRLNNDADCLSRPFSGTVREETPLVSVINASDDRKRVVWEEANNDDDDGPVLPDFDKHEEYIGPHSFIGGSLPTVTEMCKAQLADETLKKIRADLREPFYISDNDLLRLHPVGPRATHCPVAVPLCMRQRSLPRGSTEVLRYTFLVET